MIKKIVLMPHDCNWKSIFLQEKDEISKALGLNYLEAYHIGSTAVEDLVAKPKIDIIAVVKNLSESVIINLQKIDYIYKGEWNIPFKYGFTKRTNCSVNLHVFEPDHPEIEANILFRDYLIKNTDVRKSYGDLKNSLLKNDEAHSKQGSFFYQYTLGKHDFITNVLRLSGFDKLRFLYCSHPNELEFAENMRQNYFAIIGATDPYTISYEDKKHFHFVMYLGGEYDRVLPYTLYYKKQSQNTLNGN